MRERFIFENLNEILKKLYFWATLCYADLLLFLVITSNSIWWINIAIISNLRIKAS